METITTQKPLALIRQLVPNKNTSVIGDVDHMLFRRKEYSVYCMNGVIASQRIDVLVSKMLVDNDLLEPPPLESGDVKDAKLDNYFSTLPTIGVLYAMAGSRIVNYSRNMLKQDWRNLFKSNTLYEMLLRRNYESYLQPLTEIHQACDKSKKLIESMQMRVYKRATAFTWDLVVSNLVMVALYLNIGMEKVMTPPKLKFIS